MKNVKQAREFVVREVNTRRRTQNEHKGIASYENSKRMKLHGKNTDFHEKCIRETGVGTKVHVGGRVDGLTPLTHEKVIEIKCSRNRLFSTLPLAADNL